MITFPRILDDPTALDIESHVSILDGRGEGGPTEESLNLILRILLHFDGDHIGTQTQFMLYILLVEKSDITDGNSQLAVQFFRKLLLLTDQFYDVNQKRYCLTASLQAFRKFL